MAMCRATDAGPAERCTSELCPGVMLQASTLADVLTSSLGRAPLAASPSPIWVMFAPYGCTGGPSSDPSSGSSNRGYPLTGPKKVAGVQNTTAESDIAAGGDETWGCWKLLDRQLFWVDAGTVTSLVTAPGEFAVVAAIHGTSIPASLLQKKMKGKDGVKHHFATLTSPSESCSHSMHALVTSASTLSLFALKDDDRESFHNTYSAPCARLAEPPTVETESLIPSPVGTVDTQSSVSVNGLIAAVIGLAVALVVVVLVLAVVLVLGKTKGKTKLARVEPDLP